MGIHVTRWAETSARPQRAELEGHLRAEGLQPYAWANDPGYPYAWHEHRYQKVLYCVDGNIVFHTHDGDYELHPGDRLELDAGTSHAATVGLAGVECLEAHR